MKVRLTLTRPQGSAQDLVLDVDGTATVGRLAAALRNADPAVAGAAASGGTDLTLAVEGITRPATVLDPHLSVADAGIRSGEHISVATAPRTAARSTVRLEVVAGPDAGRSFPLVTGVNSVGRSSACDVELADPMVSKRHAKVVVGDVVELVDDHSSNGLVVGGQLVQRVELRHGVEVLLGESLVRVAGQSSSVSEAPRTTAGSSSTVEFNRSPRVDPQFEGQEFEAPEVPDRGKPQRFPMTMLLLPILMGAVMFTMVNGQEGGPQGLARFSSMIFILMMPLMMIGTWWENRRGNRKDFEEAVELFRSNLSQLVVEVRQALDAERAGRLEELPSAAASVEAVRHLGPLLWTRRPEHDAFLRLRLGLGRQLARTTVKVPNSRRGPVELQQEVAAAVAPFRVIDDVPIGVDFRESGALGISGPSAVRTPVARSVVAQLVALHSPAELVVVGLASPDSAREWDWLKWLPHVGSDHSPLVSEPLATTAPACTSLVDELADLVAARRGTDHAARPDDPAPTPVVFVLVEDDAPVERSAAVGIAEAGREVGVHVVWLADLTAGLPAACRTFLELDPSSGVAATGKVIQAETVLPVVVEQLDAAGADWLGRRLAPVVDAGVAADDQADVPGTVSFVAEMGDEVASATSAVVERWTESNSLRTKGVAPKRAKRDNSLRAFVGRTATDPLFLDLRSQGPHALVGGTTGAGKSEFLQTWILGMASAHSPQRVTFLFVDYKGGSAFADCVALPHSVGLVTDLSPRLVQRALVSLNAELRHREHVLNRKKAKDLLELERRGDPDTPPSLVIVVDEFAALVQEVPEFVDGVVNVAQRGRSLGLHLILATQRPAGVIKDNLRANTNLRVALRMADEEDSKDVIGTALAGTFDPGVPGRAVAKTGPGRLSLFQSGYVGGWTSNDPPPPRVQVATLAFGPSDQWEVPETPGAAADVDLGPNDIQRLVANISGAARSVELDPPRKPWLPELASSYDLAALPTRRVDADLVVGVVDEPELQSQETFSFLPDLDGNMAVFGTGGTGKSTFLRSVAVAAGLTVRGGPCFVYGLDFGARGLTMLEALPHVGSVIGADDTERISRLIRQLRETIDERAVRYAAVSAGTIDEYRRISGHADEPRVLLLLDGFGAFRSQYEVGLTMNVYDSLMSIASDGRPVGVHVVLSADRLSALPAQLVSSVQRKLALRLASDMEEGMLGVPADAFGESSVPGRGFIDGKEVQIAVLGGSPDVAEQAAATKELAASMTRAGAAPAPPVERLAESVRLDDLPVLVDGRPSFAVADETLAAFGFEPSGIFLVAGPARSGRTTAVATLVASLRRSMPGRRYVYLGTRRSPIAAGPWDLAALGVDEVAELAGQLGAELAAAPEVASRTVLVLDGLGEFVNTDADFVLQDLLRVCRANGVFVVAEGETTDVTGSWPVLQAVRAGRYGLVLQPDQMDGDTLFKTMFPRVSRVDFPEGRGFFVRNGRVTRVQVAQS